MRQGKVWVRWGGGVGGVMVEWGRAGWGEAGCGGLQKGRMG